MNKVSKYLCLLFLSAMICLFANSQQIVAPKQDSIFRILVYGKPYIQWRKASNFVGRKYNIQIVPVAACKVSSKLQDSVEKENKIVYAAIEKKYGPDFMAEFENEVSIAIKKNKKQIRKDPSL